MTIDSVPCLHALFQVWDREKIILIPDHYIFTEDERANRNVDILREFALEQDIKYFYDIKDRADFRVNQTNSLLWQGS